MLNSIYLVSLPLVAGASWWLGRHNRRLKRKRRISRYYLSGLNYLLNDEHDKAVEIFVKKMDVNPETFEAHLAFGNIFRRQGEMDRAIRVHQHLMEHPQASAEQRQQALLALAQDYLSAGILDRAELLLLDVVDRDPKSQIALEYLLDLYQQEHNWHAAIRIAKRLQTYKRPSSDRIAHYYCELAQLALQETHLSQAEWYLKQAAKADPRCLRVPMMQAECAKKTEDYHRALQYYAHVVKADKDLSALALIGMEACYQGLKEVTVWHQYLQTVSERSKHWPVILQCAQLLYEAERLDLATAILEHRQKTHPTLASAALWLQCKQQQADPAQALAELELVLTQLRKSQAGYRCSNCGYKGNVLHWICPSCKTWDALTLLA